MVSKLECVSGGEGSEVGRRDLTGIADRRVEEFELAARCVSGYAVRLVFADLDPAAASLIKPLMKSASGPGAPSDCHRDSHSSWASQ